MFDPISGAVMGGALLAGGLAAADSNRKAINTAADASANASKDANALQKYMYDKGVSLNQPFYESGLAALPYLQSAILGKPVSTPDNAYKQLSADEIAQLNKDEPTVDLQQGQNESWSIPQITGNYNGIPLFQNVNFSSLGVPAQPKYDTAKTWYRGPNGDIVSTQPTTQLSYSPAESPVASYARQIGQRNLMRALGARGLAGSGLAAYKLGQLNSEIAAGDYDKQIARLSGLVDIARGTSSNLTNLGQSYANNAANININAGENAANAQLAQGQNRASLYNGLGQMPFNLASLYALGGGKFS